MFLFNFDSLLSTDMLIILGAALIFFGPRRLPQIGRQIGKSLSEFRRASEDFKRTWEREVNLESLEQGREPDYGNSILDRATEKIRAAREAAALDARGANDATVAPVVEPVDVSQVEPHETNVSAAPPSQRGGKHEWL